MRCCNCKKEINEQDNYCIYCGENLNSNFTLNENIEFNIDNEGSKEAMKVALNKSTEYGKQAVEFIKEHKALSGIIAGVLVVIIVLLSIFSAMRGKPLSESKVKELIMGERMYICSEDITLSKDNISDFEIIDRQSKKKSYDNITSKFVIDLDGIKVEVEASIDLDYYDKKWEVSGIFENDILSIVVEEDPSEEVLNELFEYAYIIDENSNTIYFDDEYVKEITNLKFSGENESRDITADLVLSNGIMEMTYEVSGKAVYDINYMEWEFEDNKFDSKVKESVHVLDKTDDEMLSEIAKEAISRSYFKYEYKVGDRNLSRGLSISDENISEIKVNNCMLYNNDTQVRMEVEGTASMGAIEKIAFNGIIYFEASVTSSYIDEYEVSISELKVKDITVDEIKDLLLSQKVNNTSITVSDAKTFKETERNNLGDMFVQYVNGTIEIKGESKSVQIQCEIDTNDDNYQWKIKGVYTEDNSNYKKFN